MIALDTNVLVRHLYHHDDAAQTAIANRIISDAIADGEQVFVSAVVLAETSLVLSSVYRLSRSNVIRVIEALWSDPVFVLEHQGLVRAALDHCRRGTADVNDYLIGEIARRARATTVYTFDRKLRRASGFTWLDEIRRRRGKRAQRSNGSTGDPAHMVRCASCSSSHRLRSTPPA